MLIFFSYKLAPLLQPLQKMQKWELFAVYLEIILTGYALIRTYGGHYAFFQANFWTAPQWKKSSNQFSMI